MANTQTAVPLFVANQVLTAAQQNLSAGTGVPVFATTVTRDAAFGGSNKALAEGQLAYIEASNVVQYYDGAAWATVGPATSKIAQVLSTTLTTTFTTASTSYTNVTGLTVSITPTLNTSTILVIASLSGSADTAAANGACRLARGGTGIFQGDTAGSRISGQGVETISTSSMTTLGLTVLDSPATTSATTYSVQVINATAGTFYVNRTKLDSNSAAFFRAASNITVMEVLA